MRARHVLLALLIIAVGMTITASRRGAFAELPREIARIADLAARQGGGVEGLYDLAARLAGGSEVVRVADAEGLYDSAVGERDEANGVGSWRSTENAHLAVLRRDPRHTEARVYLGRMYTRWGRYHEALAILPTSPKLLGGWAALSRAFCFDALGQRSKAIALYQQVLKASDTDTIMRWAKLGLERPTWPRDLYVRPEPGERRLMPGPAWRTSASDSRPHRVPEFAVDNNLYTRWATPGYQHAQERGIWFELNLGTPHLVSRIVIDHLGVGNYDIGSWARGLEATLTSDGKTWEKVECTPGGPIQPATVRLEPARPVKAIRLILTATHDPEWWSIYELYLFGPEQ